MRPRSWHLAIMTISSRFVVGWSGWALGAALALGACGESSPFDPRTDHKMLVPEHARLDTPEPRNASRVDERESLLAEGWGEVSSGPGETHVARVLGGGSAPATGAQPVRLAAFVHLADIQLTDDESPGRVARIDGPGITSAAYRPHDAYSCHLLAAMTRSIHTVDAALRDEQGVGLDFVLLGGDNIDNAQTNELRYLQELLGPAATVECDSGADDDPVPGLQPDPNDPKDPFDAPGLALPYYWVTGNHDVLVQGNLVPNALSQAEVTGGTSVGFARDWSQPGGPPFGGGTAPAEFAELATKLLQRHDQQEINRAARALAADFEGTLGDRVRELVSYLEETGDLVTFRGRLAELAAAGPHPATVDKVRRGGFVAQLLGALRGQRD